MVPVILMVAGVLIAGGFLLHPVMLLPGLASLALAIYCIGSDLP
jgi:hypothetical protein